MISQRDDPNHTDLLQGPRQPDLRYAAAAPLSDRIALAFAAVLIFAFIMRSRMQQDAAAQLVLAQALPLDMIRPKSRPATTPSPLTPTATSSGKPIRLFQCLAKRWQQTTLRTARPIPTQRSRLPIPQGARHLLTGTTLADGSAPSSSAEQRPRPTPPPTVSFSAAPVVGIPLLTASPSGGRSRAIHRSAPRLVDFSEAIRWRGHLRDDEYAQLRELAQQQSQLGTLAESLLAMEQKTNRRYLQLATLLETSRVVAGSLDVDQVIANILTQVETLFNVQRCAVVALDQRSKLFRIRASRGLSADYVTHLRIEPSEPASASMRALRKQVPIQIADTATDPLTRRFAAVPKTKASALCSPFRSPPYTLALPCCCSTKPNRTATATANWSWRRVLPIRRLWRWKTPPSTH